MPLDKPKFCRKCQTEKTIRDFIRVGSKGNQRKEWKGCNDCAKKSSRAQTKVCKLKKKENITVKPKRFLEKELQGACLLSRKLLNKPIVGIRL